MIKIERATNGAVIYYNDGDDSESPSIYKFDEEDLDGLILLLYDVRDSMSSPSRYSKRRILVSIVHGDKYECKEKDCKICKEVA